jgi:hypothetical protein
MLRAGGQGGLNRSTYVALCLQIKVDVKSYFIAIFIGYFTKAWYPEIKTGLRIPRDA